MNKRIPAVFLSSVSALVFAGCGMLASHELTDKGMEANRQLDYRTAVACFDEAIEAGEDGLEAGRGKGIAYLGLADYDNAVASFETALANAGGRLTDLSFDTDYYLAYAYYKDGRMEDAIALLNGIIAARPEDKDAFFLRGRLALEQGNYELATVDFNNVISLDPSDYDCLLSIFRCLDAFGYTDEGGNYLKEALDRDSEKMTDYDRGRYAYYLEDYETAKNCLERARDSESAEPALFLGRTYEALGDYNYASTVYMDYIEKYGDSGEIYNQLGVCRLKMQDYENALLAFQVGMEAEKEPCLQNLKFNEIVAYEYLGDFKKAASLMEEYRGHYPDDEKAEREWKFLKTR
ncbi:MAG: tetratricopeptide repeat protein [Lachnospiraceae bacterium]|nr:tetratricopeptide repeat protein [Lachnospiraceae bacterium]